LDFNNRTNDFSIRYNIEFFTKILQGEATFTGKEIGFRSLIYPEAKGLDPNSAG
jgi:hypothetical protein